MTCFKAGCHGESCVQTVILPTVVVAGGKTMFDYHLPAKYGTVPYAVHGTYQRYNNPGKRARFRELGALTSAPS